jgi:hypothetical protein
MSRKEIHFMGLLANTDSFILNVELDNGFKIYTLPERKGVTHLSIFEGLPSREIYKKLVEFNCFSGGKLYYIDNSFESDIEMNDEGVLTSVPVGKFADNLIHDYLNPVIRLMRLFKEGNICMPFQYYYFIDNNSPKSFMRVETLLYTSQELYTLESSEIQNLQRFIQNTKLPFKESFLQLAFENFELSYQTDSMNLSFLALMISLETLFHPSDQGELRYRISRNTAVLLGKDKKDSNEIQSKVKDLYDKRSKVVHTGGLNIINEDDLLKLRHYVRESIKEINKIGKSKSKLLELLNSCGFGE